MKLQEKLNALHARFEPILPPDAVATLRRTIGELIASGQALRALQAGDPAPAFTLPDVDGETVSSVKLLRRGPLVVSFFRGTWCPFCNAELLALQDAVSGFERYDATVISISPQTVANNAATQLHNNLTYPVLADRGSEIANAYGLRYDVPLALKQVYKNLAIDLAAINGVPDWTLVMPARYVIGQDGIIAYAEINSDYTQRAEPNDALPVLEALKLATLPD